MNKVDVLVSPYLEGDDLVIDIEVGPHILTPVRVSFSELIDEYIQYHAEMFENSIAEANIPEAKKLAGMLRLAAHTLESAIA
jgi:Trk K+ transport system NAD-binding subunit